MIAISKRSPLLWTVLLFLLLSPALLFAGGSAERSNTITVIGRGELFTEPDVATVTTGVQLYNESAQAASAELGTRMESVIQAIRGLGIPENQIQTANYSIFFERDYQTPLSSAMGGSRPAGAYRVENMVRVTITDVTMAAAVVEAAIEAGANQMYGIELSLSDPDSVDAEARALAVQNARIRAEALATAAGRRLGDVVVISEVSGVGPGPLYEDARLVSSTLSGGSVHPGSTRYVVNVHVTYELQ